MIRKYLTPATLLALTLGACTPKDEPASMPPPASAEGQCGAEKLASYLGQKATEETIATIGKAADPNKIRVIRPGSAVTMDYRPDRLNIETDIDDRITRLRCG